MLAQRGSVPRRLDHSQEAGFSLKRWDALTRYLEDGREPMDNNCAARLQAGGCGHESDPVSKAERTRSVRLSERSDHAFDHASE